VYPAYSIGVKTLELQPVILTWAVAPGLSFGTVAGDRALISYEFKLILTRHHLVIVCAILSVGNVCQSITKVLSCPEPLELDIVTNCCNHIPHEHAIMALEIKGSG